MDQVQTIAGIGAAAALALMVGVAAPAQTVGTAGVPTGFGVADGTVAFSVSGSYGPRRNPPIDNTRLDASGSVIAGFGNPVSGLGVQAGVNVTSFRRFAASGYLSFGVHRMFQTSEAGVYSVALNASHLAPWGDARRQRPGYSLVGSYLTSVGGRLAMVTLGAATDTNAARKVEGLAGFGIGVSDKVAVSVGQVGARTSLGLTLAPAVLAGNTLSVSVNHNRRTGANTLVVDISRSVKLFGN